MIKKESEEFLIFQSPSHTYGRIVFGLVMPLIACWIMWKSDFSAPIILVCIIIAIVGEFGYIWLNTKLVFDQKGIYLSQFFHKKYRIMWSEIVCAGVIRKNVIGVQGQLQIIYFAKRPISDLTVFYGQTFPELCDSLLVVTAHPKIVDVIERFWGEDKVRRHFLEAINNEAPRQAWSIGQIQLIFCIQLVALLMSVMCLLFSREIEWMYAISVLLVCTLIEVIYIKNSHD